ncbi:MAG: A/G-specific adenine glycosylase [Actinomycetota bacterium]
MPARRPKTRTSAARTKAQGKVLAWFDAHGRSLPWRETRDPYRTLVAEVMLQQTGTGRVAPTYSQFLQRFPTLDRLAHAPAIDVIQAWRGLGYNRRAVELHRAAQTLLRDHGGVFPSEPAALRRLPGLGQYTASALACFAFDRQVPVVDTNVRRVLSRSALGKDPDQVPSDRVGALASEWLPAGDAYRWNQALMDIGATMCRATTPLCATCPLKASCLYAGKGRHRKPPVRKAKPQEKFEGSRRQARGTIVDHLRRAARKGITIADLTKQMGESGDADRLVEILTTLEKEGLAELTPAARKGSARGLVRLPAGTRLP